MRSDIIRVMNPPTDEKMPVLPPQQGKVRWTRATFHWLCDSGILGEGRHELINGEIVSTMPNEPHLFVNTRLFLALVRLFGEDHTRMGGSLAISDTQEPQPDVAVTLHPITDYLSTGIPGPTEFVLVVEVSSATLHKDKTEKALLYAEAGIPDYWVVDVVGRRVQVYRDPIAGEYRSMHVYDETQNLSPLANPQATLAVASFLPPLPPA